MQKMFFSNSDEEESKISETPQFWNSVDIRDSDFTKTIFGNKITNEPGFDLTRPSLSEIRKQYSFKGFDDSEKYVNMIKSEMKLQSEDFSAIEARVSFIVAIAYVEYFKTQ